MAHCTCWEPITIRSRYCNSSFVGEWQFVSSGGLFNCYVFQLKNVYVDSTTHFNFQTCRPFSGIDIPQYGLPMDLYCNEIRIWNLFASISFRIGWNGDN